MTQVAAVLGSDTSATGFVRGLLLAWLVWWLWSQFSWLGTVVDLDRQPRARLAVLAAVPPTLLIAIALPHAHDTAGLAFAAAFVAVQFWCLAIQGAAMWGDPSTRTAWLRYAPLAGSASLLLVAGAFIDGPSRMITWAAVAVFDVIAARTAGREGERPAEWQVDPSHFAERHSLFVIISLGEVLVASGAAASEAGLSWGVAGAVVACVSLACVLWWTYFAFVAEVTERTLRAATGVARGRVARDLFSFGHFPIVIGVVLYAVVVHDVVAHPGDVLHTPELAVITGSIAAFLGGFMALHWIVGRRVAPERPIAVVLVAVAAALAGPTVSGTAMVAIVAVIVAVTQAITYRRYRRLTPEALTPTDA